MEEQEQGLRLDSEAVIETPKPKRLWTSYYAKSGKHPKAVAITVVPLRTLRGLAHYPLLAPTGSLLSRWKKHLIDEFQYHEEYLVLLVKRGTPLQLLEGIADGSVLLCYERSDCFCHRHIAAGYLRRAGPDKVIIEELS